MKLIVVIAIIGVFQGLFLTINLLGRTKETQSYYSRFFLGLLIAFLSCHSLDSVLSYTREFYNFPHLFAIKDPLVLLYGPLLLFYVLSVTKSSFKLKWLHLAHLIPFFIFLIRIFPLYLRSAEYKVNILNAMYANYTNVRDISINAIFNSHIFIYLVIVLILLFKSSFFKSSQKGVMQQKKLRFLFYVMTFVFFVFTVNMVRFFIDFSLETILWVPTIMSFCFFRIAYNSLNVGSVVALSSEDHNVKILSRSSDLIANLDTLIIDEKLYLKKDLSLDELAQMLQTNRQYLSQAINNIKGLNFTRYINTFRIEEAKKLLHSKDYDSFSIEKIAEDAGYNSLSTFKRSFQDKFGQSPASFRKQKETNL